MKNFAFVMLFIGLVAGGGFWLLSEDDAVPTPAEQTAAAEQDGSNTPADSAELDPPAKAKPQPAAMGPWPKAVVEETEYNFGTMVVGSEKEHSFIIRNEGAADLELLEGQPTCKCTRFELSKSVVKPGEEAELTMRWIGKAKDAAFQHGGPVFTNDPQNREIGLRVVGVVDAAVELVPEESWNVAMGDGTAGGSMEGLVFSKVHEDFQITSLTCDSPFVEVTMTRLSKEEIRQIGMKDAPMSAYAVKVEIKPEMPPGLLEKPLKIQTDCVELPYTVLLRAKKNGPIRILPAPGVAWNESKNGLQMGRFPAAKGREAVLNLLVDETQMTEPLKFTTVEADPAFIGVELESAEASSTQRTRYRLKISIPPGIPRSSSRSTQQPATIHIETNHPSGQSIDLKLSYNLF